MYWLSGCSFCLPVTRHRYVLNPAGTTLPIVSVNEIRRSLARHGSVVSSNPLPFPKKLRGLPEPPIRIKKGIKATQKPS